MPVICDHNTRSHSTEPPLSWIYKWRCLLGLLCTTFPKTAFLFHCHLLGGCPSSFYLSILSLQGLPAAGCLTYNPKSKHTLLVQILCVVFYLLPVHLNSSFPDKDSVVCGVSDFNQKLVLWKLHFRMVSGGGVARLVRWGAEGLWCFLLSEFAAFHSSDTIVFLDCHQERGLFSLFLMSQLEIMMWIPRECNVKTCWLSHFIIRNEFIYHFLFLCFSFCSHFSYTYYT